MRGFAISLALLLCGVLRASEPDTPKQLRGEWTLKKVESQGQTAPPDKASFEFHFSDTQLTWRFVGNTTGPDQVYNCIPVKDQGDGKIDFQSVGRDPPILIHAIYKIEGDMLFICSKRDANMKPSSDRPKEFRSTRELRTDLLQLQRKPAPEAHDGGEPDDALESPS